jgi:hypothetical protein
MLPQQGQGFMSCVPGPNFVSMAAQPPAPPEPAWVPQWQAVAGDLTKQLLGVAKDAVTEEEAKTDAMLDCKRGGGTACQVFGSVANACLAVAVGVNGPHVNSGSTPAAANALSTSDCNANDTNCKVIYSACSLSRRVH